MTATASTTDPARAIAPIGVTPEHDAADDAADDVADVYGPLHAAVYDLIYDAKGYEVETASVARLIDRYASGPAERVLDLGCGTGNHAVRFARRGHVVTGIDRSPHMLAEARRKADAWGTPLTLVQADLAELDSASEPADDVADVAVMLFTVLGYLRTDDALRRALLGIRRRLRPGGLLVADHWYGPAVLASGPSTRFRTVTDGDRTLLRIAEGAMDATAQEYTTTVHL